MEDAVFKALADANRRAILDELFRSDGQTLGALCEQVPFSRQALSKHLAILQNAGLIVTHFVGREKYHYLNPVPLSDIASRWVDKFARHKVAAVTALKQALEDNPHDYDRSHTADGVGGD